MLIIRQKCIADELNRDLTCLQRHFQIKRFQKAAPVRGFLERGFSRDEVP
jgi:hypothetical protein